MAVLAFASPTVQRAAALLRMHADRVEAAQHGAEEVVQQIVSTSRQAADIIRDIIPGAVTPEGLRVCAELLESEQ